MSRKKRDGKGKGETNIAKWGKMHAAHGAKGQRRHEAQSNRKAWTF